MSDILSNNVLDRLLDPFTDCLTPPVAERIARLQADPAMQARVDQLAAKSNDGTLTAQEQAEYRQLVEAFDLIAVLQAKARSFLDRHPAV